MTRRAPDSTEPTLPPKLRTLVDQLACPPEIITFGPNRTSTTMLPGPLAEKMGKSVVAVNLTLPNHLSLPGRPGILLYMKPSFATPHDDFDQELETVRQALDAADLTMESAGFIASVSEVDPALNAALSGELGRIVVISDADGKGMAIEALAALIDQKMARPRPIAMADHSADEAAHNVTESSPIPPTPDAMVASMNDEDPMDALGSSDAVGKLQDQLIGDIGQHIISPIKRVRINDQLEVDIPVPQAWRDNDPSKKLTSFLRHIGMGTNTAFPKEMHSKDRDTHQVLVLWLNPELLGEHALADRIPSDTNFELRERLDGFVEALSSKHGIPLLHKLYVPHLDVRQRTDPKGAIALLIAASPHQVDTLRDKVKANLDAEILKAEVREVARKEDAARAFAETVPNSVNGTKLLPDLSPPLFSKTIPDREVSGLRRDELISQLVFPPELHAVDHDLILQLQPPQRSELVRGYRHERPIAGGQMLAVDVTQSGADLDADMVDQYPSQALVLWLHPSRALRPRDCDLSSHEHKQFRAMAKDFPPGEDTPAVGYDDTEISHFVGALEIKSKTRLCHSLVPATSPGGPSALVIYADAPTEQQRSILENLQLAVDTRMAELNAPDPLKHGRSW